MGKALSQYTTVSTDEDRIYRKEMIESRIEEMAHELFSFADREDPILVYDDEASLFFFPFLFRNLPAKLRSQRITKPLRDPGTVILVSMRRSLEDPPRAKEIRRVTLFSDSKNTQRGLVGFFVDNTLALQGFGMAKPKTERGRSLTYVKRV